MLCLYFSWKIYLNVESYLIDSRLTVGIDLASEFANHSGTDVTKKHYVKKTYTRERKNKLLEIRKKAGF